MDVKAIRVNDGPETISALLARTPILKPVVERPSSREVVSRPSTRTGTEKRHAAYEAEVFDLLLAKRHALGIQEVIRFRNTLVDGGLVFADGRMLAVEIKLRMNWAKACQSGWQISQFVARAATRQQDWRLGGAIVFFEEFSGDWARSTISRGVEKGWEHWYRGHAEIDTLRVDLIRARGDRLEGHPLAESG